MLPNHNLNVAYNQGTISNPSQNNTHIIQYTNHTVTFFYVPPFANALDPSTADGILDTYVKQLFKLFWAPTYNLTVTVNQNAISCGGATSCATIHNETLSLWISKSDWNKADVWVHEFTHILQFTGPTFALRDDPEFFYAEATAMATAGILTGTAVGSKNDTTLNGDFSLWLPDWGMEEAIYDYNLVSQSETHIDGRIWLGLYQLDHNVFQKLNARLNQMGSNNQVIDDIPSFRELITESMASPVIDNLAIKQWLAAEGMLARAETWNSNLLHFSVLSYEKLQTNSSEVIVLVDAISATGYLSLSATLSEATVYDAVTRDKLVDANVIELGNSVEFEAVLNHDVSAVKVDAHIVGDGFVADRSVLIPLHCSSVTGQHCQSSNFILMTTPDNWLQHINGIVLIGRANYTITNGILSFDLKTPTANITLQVFPYTIQNFIANNLTAARKVMVLGLDNVPQTSGSSNPIVTVTRPVSATITITTPGAPSGIEVTVDYTKITTPQTFTWSVGSKHTMSAKSPVSCGASCQYNFTSWNSPSISTISTSNFTYTVPSSVTSETVTANSERQYFLTINAGTGGSVTPQSGWENANTQVQIQSMPSSGYGFDRWIGTGSGSYTGSANPSNITMNEPITETSTFGQATQITVTSNLIGSDVLSVDGSMLTVTTKTFAWVAGDEHTLAAVSPLNCGSGCQYIWASWSDSGAQSHAIIVSSSATTYTATFQKQYVLTVNAGVGGSVSPVTGWQSASTAITITAAPNGGYAFSLWTGSGSGSYSGSANPSSVTMSSAITETASFSTTSSSTTTTSVSTTSPTTSPVQITVTSSTSGSGYVTVDGNSVTTPQTYTWTVGSLHTVAAVSPVGCGAGCQYVYQSWSDSGTQTHSVTAPASATTITANFQQQYQLTVTSGTGGTTSPSSGWRNSGAAVTINATPNSGYSFSAWTGSGSGSFSGSSSQATVTVNGAIGESANFVAQVQQVQILITSTQPGSGYVTVDGSAVTTPQTYTWRPGDSHTVTAISPVSCGVNCQYAYQSWSDGGGQSHSITVPSSATTYTANFQQTITSTTHSTTSSTTTTPVTTTSTTSSTTTTSSTSPTTTSSATTTSTTPSTTSTTSSSTTTPTATSTSTSSTASQTTSTTPPPTTTSTTQPTTSTPQPATSTTQGNQTSPTPTSTLTTQATTGSSSSEQTSSGNQTLLLYGLVGAAAVAVALFLIHKRRPNLSAPRSRPLASSQPAAKAPGLGKCSSCGAQLVGRGIICPKCLTVQPKFK